MSINLENMTAVQNENQEGILGHLMWCSVGKQLIKTDELTNKLIQSGLEEVWMPNIIRPADAFRRATKEIEIRKATANAGVFENYIDSGSVCRQGLRAAKYSCGICESGREEARLP